MSNTIKTTKRFYQVIHFGLFVVLNIFAGSLSAQFNRWKLQTADTKILLGINTESTLSMFALGNARNSFNWTAKPTVLPFVKIVETAGKIVETDWKFKNARWEKKGDSALVLEFTNNSPALVLTSVWQCDPGPGPVRNMQFIKNVSGRTVTIHDPASVDITVSLPGAGARAVFVSDDASIPDSVGVYNEELKGNYSKTLQISEVQDWIPFMGLNAAGKHGMYIGWEWSVGRVSVHKKTSAAAQLKAGISDDFKTDIDSGETFEVPPAFIGAYSGDLDACGNSLRRYLFRHSMPALVRTDSGFPKAQWNAFAALGKEQGSWDPVESKYYPLVDDIAPLGFEELVIDIGWWSSYGDPGHIIVDSADWPRGIPAAAQYAKNKGIRFGLYDNESENLTSDSGKSERIRDISYLIQNLQADFYRSDATAGPVLTGTYGKGQRARYKEDVSYWTIKGFYEVIDSLYRKLPGFLWEDCSSGGGLKDFGAVKRAGRVQNQDVYWPVEARRSFYDASHIYPPMQLAAVVGSWKAWQANGSVYEFRSASMGAAYWHPDAPNGGNGGPVWTAQQKKDIARAVTTYKERLRPLIRNADLFHIFPRPDSVNWDGVQYFDAVSGKGVVYMFKPSPSTVQHTIRLKGLLPGAFYSLSFEDGSNPATVRKGSDLMNKGITVTLSGSLVSELMFIQKE